MSKSHTRAAYGYKVHVTVLRVEKLAAGKGGTRYRLHCKEGIYLTEPVGSSKAAPKLSGSETGEATLFIQADKTTGWHFTD